MISESHVETVTYFVNYNYINKVIIKNICIKIYKIIDTFLEFSNINFLIFINIFKWLYFKLLFRDIKISCKTFNSIFFYFKVSNNL